MSSITDRVTLRTATAFFAVGFVVHHLDHLRRGYGVVEEGVIVGRTVAAMLAAVLFTLVVTRHRTAPLAAVVVGSAVVIGVVLVRVVPPFGPPSDHLGADGTDTWSWLAVGVELVAAAMLVGVGVRDLQRR
ncbi:MAG: hypothetical protein AAGE98_16680 [Actinomycetota bacterium]